MKLSFLFVFCFFILHAALCTEAIPDWGCLSGYHYYRTINITASEAVEDGEYPFTLDTAAEVSAGRLQSSGYDMIFTDTTGCVKYCFFIELTTMNNEATKVWVRIPGQITPPVTLLWVYGNSGKAAPDSTQSGSCAFNFFTDFSSSSAPSSATSRCVGDSLSVTTNETTTSLDWKVYGGLNANITFTTVNTVWTFEAYVTEVRGEYPGVFAYNSNTTLGGYGLVNYPGSLNLGWVWPMDAASDTCSCGWDWPTTSLPFYQDFPVIWSLTWLEEAKQLGEQRLPDGTLLHSNEGNYTVWPMTKGLTFFVGGIDMGDGGVGVSWMRARKYNPTVATSSPSTLQNVMSSSASTLSSSSFLLSFIQLIPSSIVTQLSCVLKS